MVSEGSADYTMTRRRRAGDRAADAPSRRAGWTQRWSLGNDEGAARKSPFRPYHSIRVPKSAILQPNTFGEADPEPVPTVTTVMLRHIPNKYTQATLLSELNQMGFAGRYDFFYLPMDVQNRTNVGYAFINFLTPQDAARFSQKLTNYKFQHYSSQKIASVSPAHVQGLVRNLFHFSNRAVSQSRDLQYRPIVVRNGCYRDCCEVLNEMLLEAEQPQTPPAEHVQHQRPQPPPPPRSNLNPSAQIFVPKQSASAGETSCEGAAEDSSLSGALDDAPESPEAWINRGIESIRTEALQTSSLHLSSKVDAGVKDEGELEQDDQFEKTVLSWLQDEDPKTRDPFEMSSTDDGSYSSASGRATPTASTAWTGSLVWDHGRVQQSFLAPAEESAETLSPRTSKMLLGSDLWDASSTMD